MAVYDRVTVGGAPGNDGTDYTVNIKKYSQPPITEGIGDFAVKSEQYYIHETGGQRPCNDDVSCC